jgi:hypothetical protein
MSAYLVDNRDGDNRWAFDEHSLHCGDCFQIYDPVSGLWLDVRIEMAGSGWYLVGLPAYLAERSLYNFMARRHP